MLFKDQMAAVNKTVIKETPINVELIGTIDDGEFGAKNLLEFTSVVSLMFG